MTSKTTKFDLVANAKDSLAHAVAHISNTEDKSPSKWKIAVREVAHVVELLLKERLRREHPALIWIKVDDYPSMDARTVGAEEAALRLHKICNICLPKSDLETVKACRKLRNRIEHCEFQLNEAEAKGIVGRLLSFILDFSKTHLSIDLEKEFRADDSWRELIEIVEFREAHGKVIAEKFIREKTPADTCPACGEYTFSIDDERCQLCDHHESLLECEQCKNLFFESECETATEPDSDEDHVFCKNCFNDIMYADEQYDTWKDSQL